MSQYTQSELDETEADTVAVTKLVDIGGFSPHNGFTELSDDITDTDCTPPTDMFRMSERALRHQERSRTQDEKKTVSTTVPDEEEER